VPAARRADGAGSKSVNENPSRFVRMLSTNGYESDLGEASLMTAARARSSLEQNAMPFTRHRRPVARHQAAASLRATNVDHSHGLPVNWLCRRPSDSALDGGPVSHGQTVHRVHRWRRFRVFVGLLVLHGTWERVSRHCCPRWDVGEMAQPVLVDSAGAHTVYGRMGMSGGERLAEEAVRFVSDASG
jgi:hypothetical protein